VTPKRGGQRNRKENGHRDPQSADFGWRAR
jgi:hypothetical protein